MERQVEGKGAAEYLWEDKKIVPFLKVDQGLADEAARRRLMKPMDRLDALLASGEPRRVRHEDALGHPAGRPAGIDAVVASSSRSGDGSSTPGSCRSSSRRWTSTARRRASRGAPTAALARRSTGSARREQVMLKLTLPEEDDLYTALSSTRGAAGRRAVRRVLPRGGQERLARNHGVVASFSRALTEGLSAQQSEAEFDPCSPPRSPKSQLPQGLRNSPGYSHSMVPGGLLVTSRTTRLTSATSLVIRVEMRSSTSYGTRVQSAVMASSLDTGRSTIG